MCWSWSMSRPTIWCRTSEVAMGGGMLFSRGILYGVLRKEMPCRPWQQTGGHSVTVPDEEEKSHVAIAIAIAIAIERSTEDRQHDTPSGHRWHTCPVAFGRSFWMTNKIGWRLLLRPPEKNNYHWRTMTMKMMNDERWRIKVHRKEKDTTINKCVTEIPDQSQNKLPVVAIVTVTVTVTVVWWLLLHEFGTTVSSTLMRKVLEWPTTSSTVL